MIYLGIILWIACGVLSFGLYLGAHKHSEYAWTDPHILSSLVMSLAGPCSLVATINVCGVKHFSLKPHTISERFKIHEARFSILNRTIDDFDKI